MKWFDRLSINQVVALALFSGVVVALAIIALDHYFLGGVIMGPPHLPYPGGPGGTRG